MIVLRTPKGWTGPDEVDGQPVEGTFRAHQVPLAEDPRRRRAPRAAGGVAALLPRPRSCSTPTGAPVERAALHGPGGQRRMSANPHANGGLLLRDLRLPDFRDLRGRRCRARRQRLEPTARARAVGCATSIARQPARPSGCSGPDEMASNRLERRLRRHRPGLEGRDRARRDDHLAPDGRVDGGALRAPVPGLAGGLPAHRPARPVHLLRGVHPHRRLDVQPARQVAEGHPRHPVAPPDRLA